jgi:hypothetical protein
MKLFFASLLTLFLVFGFRSNVYANDHKGVNWHMGAWYGAAGASGYNWDGLRKDLDNMKAGKIDWVRFSFGSSTQSSCYPSGFYTQLSNELSSRGMSGLPIIYIPNPLTTMASDAEIASYKSWLSTMVNCYKNNFRYFEVYNEPNLHYFWNIDENTTDNAAYALSVSYYVKYLKASYETIKAIDPNINILIGGLSQWKMERFMDELKNQGAGQYFDIMSYHPYSDTGSDGVLTMLNNLKAKMAIDPLISGKPIWITEIGFTTTSGAGPGYVSTEQTKADYLTQTFQKLYDNGINQYPIFWYDWDMDPCCATGYNLVLTDRTAPPYIANFLPAYFAMQNVLNCGALGDIDCSGHVNVLDLSILISKFGQSDLSGDSADLDASGQINSLDLGILFSHMGQ